MEKIGAINSAILKFILLFEGVFKKMGCSIPQLKAILTYKLIMDDRRPASFSQLNKKQLKPGELVSGQTWTGIYMSALLGLYYLTAFNFSNDITTNIFMYFTLYMVMLASTLISDFTSVLIDVRDNFIIMPKPVNDRTVVMGRLLHILIHVSKLVLPMSLPGFVYMLVRRGPVAGIAFFIMILLATLFAVFAVNALYIIILRFTSPAKFKSLISWFQVIFAIALFALYVLVPRLANKATFSALELDHYRVVLAIPSYWFAAGWGVFTGLHSGTVYYTGAVLLLVIPFLSLWLVIKYLAPAFNRKLSMIGGSGESREEAKGNAITTNRGRSLSHWLSSFLVKNNEARMGFRFTWIMTGRSRDFKLKVLPNIGVMLVIVISNTYGRMQQNGFDTYLRGDKPTMQLLLVATYSSIMVLFAALVSIVFSEQSKAAWWYFTTPVKKPGMIISGALRAVIVKFFAPVAITVVIVAAIYCKPVYYPSILLAICNQVLIISLFAVISFRVFPFSTEQNTNSKTGSVLKTFLVLGLGASLALIQYLLADNLPLITGLIVVSVGCSWLLMKTIEGRKVADIN